MAMIGDNVRFLHKGKKVLKGKIIEKTEIGTFLILVFGDTSIHSLDGTICNRNEGCIIEVI